MIDEYKIVIATTLSNAVSTGYYPVSFAAIKSWSAPHYVDEVLIAEGMSKDNTVELHKNISSKVKILSKKLWPIDSWTWRNLYDQYDVIYDYCRFVNNQQKTILVYLSADQVFTSYFVEELERELLKLVQDKTADYFLLPFAKTITYEFLSIHYDPLDHFHVHSAIKFDEDRDWLGVRGWRGHGEDAVITPNIKLHEPVPLEYSFFAYPFSYDMFLFTKENLMDKIQRHGKGIFANDDREQWGKLGTTHYIRNHWLKKMIPLLAGKIKLKDHPPEILELMFEYLDESRFGYSCFGNLAGSFNMFLSEE